MEDFGGNGHEYGDNFDNDGTGWDEPSMTNGDGEGGGTDVEEEAPKASSRRGKVAATDDDVEDRRARSKAKGKGRAPVQDEAEEGGVSEVEEDIQQGLEALDMEDDEEEEEPQKPGPSKRRKKNSDEKKPAKPVVSRKSRRLEAPNRSRKFFLTFRVRVRLSETACQKQLLLAFVEVIGIATNLWNGGASSDTSIREVDANPAPTSFLSSQTLSEYPRRSPNLWGSMDVLTSENDPLP
jgi:hypothetical protein